MSIDKLIGDAIKAKPRHFITKEILHSVLVQESELCSTFERSDEQYRLNMSTAIKMTGKTEAEILKLVTLQTGKIAKFRLEPSYFNKEDFKKLTFETRFYLSISTGLAQKMGALLVGKSYNNAKSIIMGFAGNEPLQVLYAAGDMEAGMQRAYLSPSVTKKDIKSLTFYAYCAYNGGPSNMITKDQKILKRAQEVVSRL